MLNMIASTVYEPTINKLLIMYNHSALVLLFSVGLILSLSNNQSVASSRKNNDNGNVFNLLLGLYKINPLKGSPVFQSFSKNLLMGMGRDTYRIVLNPESSESIKENQQMRNNLNEIEKMIHTRDNKTAKHFEKPAYDLDDVSTENFKAELVMDDVGISKEEFQKNFMNNHNAKEDFSLLFDHIGSSEIYTDIPVTKLLTVNDSTVQYSHVSNKYEEMFELKESKSIPSTLAKFRDKNLDEVSMDNLVEGTGDVIVF